MRKGTYHHTPEARAKISAANRGEKNHMWGKHHTPETIAKIRAANTGKKHSPETKAKISAALWRGGCSLYWHKKAWKLLGKDYCEVCEISLEEYSHNHSKKQRFEMHCFGDYKNLSQENWICVCVNCHRKFDAGRRKHTGIRRTTNRRKTPPKVQRPRKGKRL